MAYLKLGAGALGLALLAGCATTTLHPSAAAPLPVPPVARHASVAVRPAPTSSSRSLLRLYARNVWPKQEQMDQVLVIACVRHTAYQLQHTAPAWAYAGKGRYQEETPRLRLAPSCWNALAKVFENQERGAVTTLGNHAAPVRRYYRDSTAWALYCESRARTETGLQECLSPQALTQVRMDRQRISEDFD